MSRHVKACQDMSRLWDPTNLPGLGIHPADCDRGRHGWSERRELMGALRAFLGCFTCPVDGSMIGSKHNDIADFLSTVDELLIVLRLVCCFSKNKHVMFTWFGHCGMSLAIPFGSSMQP